MRQSEREGISITVPERKSEYVNKDAAAIRCNWIWECASQMHLGALFLHPSALFLLVSKREDRTESGKGQKFDIDGLSSRPSPPQLRQADRSVVLRQNSLRFSGLGPRYRDGPGWTAGSESFISPCKGIPFIKSSQIDGERGSKITPDLRTNST